MLEMDTFLKEFGQTLKTRRKEMGLSQVTAAQNMKIDYRHYQNIEGGKINLRLDTMMKLINFYKLTNERPVFSLDSFFDILHGGQSQGPHQNWQALYEHFVEGGHAGYLVVNCDARTIADMNQHLIHLLGLRDKSQVVGRPAAEFMNESGLNRLQEFCTNQRTDAVSDPFIVAFKPQPPGFPIPMMALIRVAKDPLTGMDKVYCMFFDRKTLDEEGHRLTDIVSGFKQFMELYPQLKAV